MAENFQQFSSRNYYSSYSSYKAANEVSVSMVADNQRLENKLTELTSLVRQLDNPYFNTYNPGWRDHPNLRYGPSPHQQQHQYQAPPFGQQQQQFQQPQPTPTPAPPVQNSSGPSLEELMKQMATSNIQFQTNLSATIHDLQTQIGQLATTINHMQQPPQTIVNPQVNESAITLRSGKELPKQPTADAKIDDIVHSKENSVFILDAAVNNLVNVDIDTCTNLLSEFPEFSNFDFNSDSSSCTCDNHSMCPICAEIASAIYLDRDSVGFAGTELDAPPPKEVAPSLPPVTKPLLPFIIHFPSLELEPLIEHLNFAYLDDAQQLQALLSNIIGAKHVENEGEYEDVTHVPPWFADIYIDKLQSNGKYFVWEVP